MMDAPWQCNECGRDVDDPTSEELRELIEQCRETARAYRDDPDLSSDVGVGVKMVANELEALLDE